jgi:hypothetical protein
MSSLGYVDLLRLLDEVERVGKAQTLKISLDALAGAAPGSHAGPADAQPTMFDSIRTNDLLYEETQRLRGALLSRLAELGRAARPPAASPPPEPVGAPSGAWTEQEVLALLDGAQMAMIKHPTATQAAFAALVREGRRFAETEEGGKWLEVLQTSDFVRRARWVWETTSLNMLEEGAGTIVPSTYPRRCSCSSACSRASAA